MHITVNIVDTHIKQKDIDDIFNYFISVDNTFSPYKETSEVSHINQGVIPKESYSQDMQMIIRLGEQTKRETQGYFDMYYKSNFDPSGIVKGWAIWQAAKLLEKKGYKNFFIDAGGDIQVSGRNENRDFWVVGIRNPFNQDQIVKVLQLQNKGIATSGTAERGQHIYNPHKSNTIITDIVSLTVIGSNVYEADRFATAAFAMGKKGITFIEHLPDFEGYMIDKNGIASYTSGFEKYVVKNNFQ